MNITKFFIYVLFVLFFWSSVALAQEDTGNTPDNSGKVSWLFDFGYDFGGDKLVTVIFVSGETKSLNANEGLFVDAGVSIPNNLDIEGKLETQLTVGYKYAAITGSNGSVKFTTVPFTLTELYTLEQGINFGAGLTYQLNPKVSGSGVLGWMSLPLDNAFGYLVQVGYSSDNWNLGLKYTILNYKSPAIVGNVNGNSVGIFASAQF